ncbi:hypothetical protein CR513_22467, partial [Mucuna pruriens]
MAITVKMSAEARASVIENWDKVAAFMAMPEMDALSNCNWSATIQVHQKLHLGYGLSQCALPLVTKQEPCASVEKAQNIQIDHYQTYIQTPSIDFNWQIFSLIINTLYIPCICFSPSSEPGGSNVVDWTKLDQDVFTTQQMVLIKNECECNYDDLVGQFCEVSVQSTCINQCSGHGLCGGICQEILLFINPKKLVQDVRIILHFVSVSGMDYGVDCSTPSVISSVREWPNWFRPAQIDIPDNQHFVKKGAILRLYDHNNETIWTDELYGAQIALYESILASPPHRTLSSNEADFFFVAVLDACLITRANDAPHLSTQVKKCIMEYACMSFSLYLKG